MANIRPILSPREPLEKWLAQFLPHVSIDCVVFGFHGAGLKLLLLKWKGVDTWTLPGGYVGHRQSVDDAAHQVLQARTGLRRVHLRQFHAFGDLGRKEATGRRAVPQERATVTARATCGCTSAWSRSATTRWWTSRRSGRRPTPGADSCAWYPVESHPPLAYDHDRIVEGAREALRAALDVPGAGASLLPERFTMPELQSLHEAILGRRLDRRNFQKRMLERGGIERLPERRTGGAHRAPVPVPVRGVARRPGLLDPTACPARCSGGAGASQGSRPLPGVADRVCRCRRRVAPAPLCIINTNRCCVRRATLLASGRSPSDRRPAEAA